MSRAGSVFEEEKSADPAVGIPHETIQAFGLPQSVGRSYADRPRFTRAQRVIGIERQAAFADIGVAAVRHFLCRAVCLW